MAQKNGFTLVELAIALMVIGLLIGGVLKGQELIENARITATIRQIKAYQTAHLIFRNIYGTIPGDISKARTRLPDCSTANNCRNGNGNGIIGNTGHWGNNVDAGPNGENTQYWKHIALAGLITGIDTQATTVELGKSHPGPDLGAIFFARGADSAQRSYAAHMRGNMIIWRGLINGAGSASAGTATSPRTAAVIDEKMDDGLSYSGDVEALSGGAPGYWGGPNMGCNSQVVAATAPSGYEFAQTEITCGMAFKL